MEARATCHLAWPCNKPFSAPDSNVSVLFSLTVCQAHRLAFDDSYILLKLGGGFGKNWEGMCPSREKAMTNSSLPLSQTCGLQRSEEVASETNKKCVCFKKVFASISSVWGAGIGDTPPGWFTAPPTRRGCRGA